MTTLRTAITRSYDDSMRIKTNLLSCLSDQYDYDQADEAHLTRQLLLNNLVDYTFTGIEPLYNVLREHKRLRHRLNYEYRRELNLFRHTEIPASFFMGIYRERGKALTKEVRIELWLVRKAIKHCEETIDYLNQHPVHYKPIYEDAHYQGEME